MSAPRPETREARLTPGERAELVLARILARLPIDWAVRIGGMFGAGAARRALAARRPWVERLGRHLADATGTADPAARDALVVDYARRIGGIYAQFPLQQRMMAEGRVEIDGLAHLAAASRPVIIASCHVGNWELIGRVAALAGGRNCALYLPQVSQARERLAREARARWPIDDLVPASPSAMLRISRALGAGSNLVLLVDEERDGYVFAPSLGRTLPYAGNRWFAARLALQHGVDILPVFVAPTGLARYRIEIQPKLPLPHTTDRNSAARALADALDARVDAWVRPRLPHWFWLASFDKARPPPRPASGQTRR
jgi:KDO2-lipid IV(A) lauroyltransferase